MSTVTDAEVEAGLREFSRRMSDALGISWGLWASRERPELTIAMRAALETAEAVRVKPITMMVSADPRVSQSAAFMTPAESNLQKVQIPTSTIPEGFIPWHGGECPVQGCRVSAVFRRGEPWVLENPENFFWLHEDADDIIAYRVHKPADFRLEAGKFYVTASGERVGPMRRSSGAYGSTYHDSDGWGRWWWPNGEIGLLGSCDPDILALSSNQESGHD